MEKEISIPFNQWSKDRLLLEKKWATSRTKKYGNIGDYFFVDFFEYDEVQQTKELVARNKYIIDYVVKLPLFFIANELFRSEGCVASEDFRRVWVDIHPRKGFVYGQMVWYHYFYLDEKF